MLTGQRTDETFQCAAAHYRSGDLPEAERICREVLHRSPADGDALHLLGLIRLIAADYASARDFLQQAATAAPEDHLCHYNLGEAYRCLGLFAEAVESYERAIALRPAFTEARNNLGIILADLGLIDAAIGSYEQALLTAPDSTRTLMNLGSMLIEAGRFPEAITCFGRVISLDADCMEAYHGFCRASADLLGRDRALPRSRVRAARGRGRVVEGGRNGLAREEKGCLGDRTGGGKDFARGQADYRQAFGPALEGPSGQPFQVLPDTDPTLAGKVAFVLGKLVVVESRLGEQASVDAMARPSLRTFDSWRVGLDEEVRRLPEG